MSFLGPQEHVDSTGTTLKADFLFPPSETSEHDCVEGFRVGDAYPLEVLHGLKRLWTLLIEHDRIPEPVAVMNDQQNSRSMNDWTINVG